MLPPLSHKLIVHLDMNSFFASVEQQANVHWRGRPLGVCAYLHRFGCVIAASVEAKRLGMKVRMTVDEAKRVCPEAVFVENDPPKYRAVSSAVFSLCRELTDRVEPYSIDEAFLDLTGWYRDAAEASWALTKLRRRMRDEIGDWLRCSIGIAPTRFLAKTASDIKKPNGLTIITLENLDDTLSKLQLESVCGIGRRTRRHLERLGLFTLMDVKRAPIERLMQALGKQGFFLWCRLHGLEYEAVHTLEASPPKSIGHSYCVPRRVNQEGNVIAVLVRLTERAGRRLRRHGLFAGKVSVVLGFRAPDWKGPKGLFWNPFVQQSGGSANYTNLSEPASDSFALVRSACRLMEEMWHGQDVDFMAVTLSDLTQPVPQGVFVSMSKDTRHHRLSSAIDLVRDRYGDESIMFASMMKLGNEAPDRIGFRKVDG